MHANRARLLRNANNGLLHFLVRHDQVGQLIHHKHKRWQLLWNARLLQIIGRLQAQIQFFFAQIVVRGDVAAARVLQHAVALLHFVYGPFKNAGGL